MSASLTPTHCTRLHAFLRACPQNRLSAGRLGWSARKHKRFHVTPPVPHDRGQNTDVPVPNWLFARDLHIWRAGRKLKVPPARMTPFARIPNTAACRAMKSALDSLPSTPREELNAFRNAVKTPSRRTYSKPQVLGLCLTMAVFHQSGVDSSPGGNKSQKTSESKANELGF